MEFDVSESLCKAVCNHLVGWNVREFDSLRGHLVTDVVVLDIDVFAGGAENQYKESSIYTPNARGGEENAKNSLEN